MVNFKNSNPAETRLQVKKKHVYDQVTPTKSTLYTLKTHFSRFPIKVIEIYNLTRPVLSDLNKCLKLHHRRSKRPGPVDPLAQLYSLVLSTGLGRASQAKLYSSIPSILEDGLRRCVILKTLLPRQSGLMMKTSARFGSTSYTSI